jgi:hypothetical protein
LQLLVFVDLFLKVMNLIIPFLKLSVKLLEKIFQFHVQNFDDILVNALSHIEELNMQSIFEFFRPLIMCVSQIINLFKVVLSQTLDQFFLFSDFGLKFFHQFFESRYFLLLGLNLFFFGVNHFRDVEFMIFMSSSEILENAVKLTGDQLLILHCLGFQ